MATINISLPKGMHEDMKKLLKEKHYASMSELIRDSMRRELYPNITVNGFTPEFEEEVLRASAEPDKGDTWESPEDVDNFFKTLRKEIKSKHA